MVVIKRHEVKKNLHRAAVANRFFIFNVCTVIR